MILCTLTKRCSWFFSRLSLYRNADEVYLAIVGVGVGVGVDGA